VILAGILLKMGGYGFLRFSLPMFPIASMHLAPLVFALSVVAIIYTSLVALAQQDMKKLIAYSSVAHMGFVTMGVFAATVQGVEGGIFQMFSHGLVSGALFLCVGVIYDRMHTREIAAYGGLVNRMPMYAFVLMFFTLCNVGLPGTSGFVGEFLSLVGTFAVNTWVALFAATGVILSACYMLWMYRRVIFGPLTKPSLQDILDMNIREVAVLTPLVVGAFIFGVSPTPILNITEASVKNMLSGYQTAVAEYKAEQATKLASAQTTGASSGRLSLEGRGRIARRLSVVGDPGEGGAGSARVFDSTPHPNPLPQGERGQVEARRTLTVTAER
jgi:NADH-quinone oxidoreductase subunit M